jgi:hypothetical protein
MELELVGSCQHVVRNQGNGVGNEGRLDAQRFAADACTRSHRLVLGLEARGHCIPSWG